MLILEYCWIFNPIEEFIVPIVTAVVIAIILKKIHERKSKLTVYVGNVSIIKTTTSYVHSFYIVLTNNGKLKAENIRIQHLILPEYREIIPHVKSYVDEIGEGLKDLVIEQMVPGEQLTIQYLYYVDEEFGNRSIKFFNGIKCDDGYVKVEHYLPTKQFPNWVNLISLALMFVGAVSIIYYVMKLIVWFYDLSKLLPGS